MKKDIFIIILVLVLIGLLVLLIAILGKTNKFNKSLEEERYNRMVAEESLQKKEAKLVTLEAQLNTANEKMIKIQQVIDQEKVINNDLQKQYDELNKTKEDLESKLKITIEEKATSTVQPAPVAAK